MLLTRRRCSPRDDDGRPNELAAKHEDGDAVVAPGSRKGQAGATQTVPDASARPRRRHARPHRGTGLAAPWPDQPHCSSHAVPALIALLRASQVHCSSHAQEEARAAGPRRGVPWPSVGWPPPLLATGHLGQGNRGGAGHALVEDHAGWPRDHAGEVGRPRGLLQGPRKGGGAGRAVEAKEPGNHATSERQGTARRPL
jgi:hypothetical protein